MVQKCVVYGCSNTKDEKKGISIHPIPFYGDPRPEAVKRRRKWISFVSATRKMDCQQILGCMFGAFRARRLCTAVLQRKHITAKIKKG